MEKRSEFYIGLLLLWILLVGGCTKAEVPDSAGNETDGLVPVVCILHQEAVTVVQMSDTESDTKSVVTKAGGDETINDLTILQFASKDDNASCITSRYLYKPVPEAGTTDQYSIGLRATENESYILFIANAGNVFASYENMNKTLGDFRQEAMELDQKTTNDLNILMIGGQTVTIATGNTGKLISIELKRPVARIRFTWEAKPTVTNTQFTPLALKLRNVPKTFKYMDAVEKTTEVYPASSAENFKDYTSIVDRIDEGFTWYIPMNRRGIKEDKVIKAWEKTAENAPDKYCTYIELSGIFRTPNMPDQLATYRFYIGSHTEQNGTVNYNNYDVEANGAYNVNATIVGVNTFDLRVTKKNFVYSEPANCFMVSPEAGSEISFNPYKAPGTDVAGSGIVYTDQMMEDRYSKIAGVKLIWQTSPNLIDVSTEQGMVNVVPNDKGVSGNALIGVHDESNKLLWSWHIWVTPYAAIVNDNKTNPLIGTRQKYNNQEWMDRNLGALDIIITAVAELMYQWGRKDPFLKNTMYTSDGNSFSFSTSARPPDPIISSVKAPDTFYTVSGGGTWFGDAKDMDNLWQNKVKTVFDPCPYGWRVPPKGSWDGFLQNVNFYTWNYDRYSEYIIGSGEKAIYRLGGRINNNGALDNKGVYGFLWSSTCSEGTKEAYSLYYQCTAKPNDSNVSKGEVYPDRLQNQGLGFSVRCVKINN